MVTDNARSTYDRYQAARRTLGFNSDDNPGIAWHVWVNCQPDARESMAQQLEQPAREVAARGPTWGAF